MTEVEKYSSGTYAAAKEQMMYHYTSPNCLLSILNKDTPSLYFTQYDYLNDPKERKDIYDVIAEYCNEKYGNNEMPKELYEYIKDILPTDRFRFLKNNLMDISGVARKQLILIFAVFLQIQIHNICGRITQRTIIVKE